MKSILLLLTISLLFIKVNAQPNIVWQKAYGGSNLDNFSDIKSTNDGGYILIGTANSTDGDIANKQMASDVWVVKVNSTGGIEWEKCYGGDSSDIGVAIDQTTDGGFIMLGTTSSNNGDVSTKKGFTDIWVVKLTSTGVISWEKTYGGSNSDIAKSIIKTTDGGYTFVGYSKSADGDIAVNKGDFDVWVVKIDNAGIISWEKTFGGSAADYGYSISGIASGGYIIAGETISSDGDISNNKGQSDYYVIKISNSGSSVWQKTFGGTMTDRAYSAVEAKDGSIVIAGTSNSTDQDIAANKGGNDMWVVKVDGNGTLIWQKTLGGTQNDYAFHISEHSTGRYIISGQTFSNDGDISGLHGTSSDIWATELYTDGTIKWKKTIGGNGADNSLKVIETSDNGYLVGGVTQSNDGDANNSGYHASTDIWLVRLSSTTAIEDEYLNDKIKVYPTLTNDYIYFDLSKELVDSKCYLYNTVGQLLKKDMSQTMYRSMDLTSYPSGTYMVYITNGNAVYSNKIIYSAK